MSLQYYLRLALVGLTLSVVGCLADVSIGDITDDSKIKTSALENFKSVNSSIQNPMKNTLQRNIEQFTSKYQLPWINSASYNLRNDGNAKTPSFSPTDTRASADVTYKVQSNVNSRNNPVELSSITFNDGIDAKRSYALQTVQQERNPFDFKVSQMSSSDINLALGQVRENGGMHAANVYRSGSFGYQHTSKSKSEMYPDSSRPLGLNEPYFRENIPTNYISRSSTVNHMRHKSNGNMLFDHFRQNNGQDQNVLRRVVPANTTPSVVRANQKGRKPLQQAFSAWTGVISQTSDENMRDVAFSKVFKPSTIPTPISPAFKRSNSNGGHSVIPLKKSQMFSSQHDLAKLSNSERAASAKANPRSSFDYGNTKSATNNYLFKDIQLTSTQNGYQNKRQSSQNIAPFHNEKKYNNLATGISAFRSSVTNNAGSYFLSDENSGTQMSALLNWSKQNTDLTPRMQFAKNTKLISERNTNSNLPNSTNHSLMKPSQHNIRNRTALKSFGQSTVQLSVKHYPAPSLVPSNAMKNVHSFNPSVSGTQGTSKNSDTSSSQNRPYYLTSKKPFAFKGFSFIPTFQTSLQKTDLHSLPNSSNVQYAPARPRTTLSALTQKPLIRERNEKTLFQYKDIETSQEKQPYRDQTDSFDNGPQRGTISSTEGASNPMSVSPKYHVRGQAVVMKTSLSGTNTTNNGAIDVVQSKTSLRWTSNRLTSAQHTESNQDDLPTVRSSNGRFVGSNSIKSINSHKNATSELILPFHKASLMNKVTGYPQINNAVIQPLRRYSLKEHEGLLNPSSKEINDRTTAGITQSNVTKNYNPIKLRPTSSVVLGRRVEVTQEEKRFEEKSNQQNIYAIPNSQSTIYRSADVTTPAKHTFQSPIHRSAIKPFGKVSNWRNGTSQNSETDIDLNAIGVSQASRPTSSFVVAKYINTSDKGLTKPKLTKTTRNNYKPVRFSDIAGSASFTNMKPRSSDTTAKEEVDLGSDQNSSNSTPVFKESFKPVFWDSSFMISSLQNETDESAVDFMSLSVPELMPTDTIKFTTQSQLSFTEEYTQPQPTVYSSESQLDPEDHTTPTTEDIDFFREVTLIPNTTLLDKMTSG